MATDTKGSGPLHGGVNANRSGTYPETTVMLGIDACAQSMEANDTHWT